MCDKILLIGLDGASFNILDPLLRLKKVPNLCHLYNMGTNRYLTSTIPSNTPVAWTSISTGKNPGKHGIFGFFNYDNDEMKAVSSLNNKSPTMWEILGQNEKTSLIINVPFTWPPKKIKGIIACFDWTPAEMGETKSILAAPDFVNNYIKDHNYFRIATFHPDWKSHDLASYKEIVEVETDFAMQMAHSIDWNLMFIVFRVTDTVIHLSPTNNELITRVYEIIDEAIGRLIQLVNLRRDQVFVISDHGTKVFKKGYPIPALLNEHKLLILKNNANSYLTFVYQLRDTLYKWSQKLSKGKADEIFNKISKYYYQTVLKNKDANFEGNGEKRDLRSLIDKGVSPLYLCNENSGIDVLLKINKNVCVGNNPPSLDQQLLTFIIEKINKNGKKIVTKGWNARELYSGPHLMKAPDLILEMNEEVGAVLSPFSHFQKARIVHKIMGGHMRKGVLIAAGKDITPNTHRDEVNILDIVPTILYSLNVPIPKNVDGRVLTRLFSIDRLLVNHPKFIDLDAQKASSKGYEREAFTSEQEKMFKRRLLELGYI